VITFSERVALASAWTADRSAIGFAIDRLAASGNTSLEDAMFAALTLRERARGRMLVLAFSGGFDTASRLDPLRVSDQAPRPELVVDVVSLSMQPTVAVMLGQTPKSRVSGESGGQEAKPPAIGRKWFLEEPMPFREQFLPVLAEETGGETLSAGRADL